MSIKAVCPADHSSCIPLQHTELCCRLTRYNTGLLCSSTCSTHSNLQQRWSLTASPNQPALQLCFSPLRVTVLLSWQHTQYMPATIPNNSQTWAIYDIQGLLTSGVIECALKMGSCTAKLVLESGQVHTKVPLSMCLT